MGPWFVASCAFNSLWIVLFTFNTAATVWLSTVARIVPPPCCQQKGRDYSNALFVAYIQAIFGLLTSLLMIYVRAPLWPCHERATAKEPTAAGGEAPARAEAWVEWLVMDGKSAGSPALGTGFAHM